MAQRVRNWKVRENFVWKVAKIVTDGVYQARSGNNTFRLSLFEKGGFDSTGIVISAQLTWFLRVEEIEQCVFTVFILQSAS